jgi:hypothetical protein
MFDGAAASLPFLGFFLKASHGVKIATSFFLNPVTCQHITLGKPTCKKKSTQSFRL